MKPRGSPRPSALLQTIDLSRNISSHISFFDPSIPTPIFLASWHGMIAAARRHHISRLLTSIAAGGSRDAASLAGHNEGTRDFANHDIQAIRKRLQCTETRTILEDVPRHNLSLLLPVVGRYRFQVFLASPRTSS